MSLWSSRKRKNAAEQEERAWNQNRPADYVSRQKDAMDAVTGQVGSGFDWNTGDEAYQQYRKLSAANAQAGADNARANADLLAGGYGSSYADSVARQGQQQALASIDSALPSLRGQALTEYQNQQSNLLNALSGMASTEALDRSAYGANLAQYNNWKNFLANQSAQARTAYANDKANAWNWVKNVGSAVLNAYDTYKGFSQQRMQLQTQAINYAAQLKQQGADDMAKAVLEIYKVDPSILDNWDGQSPITWQDQLSGIATASGLMGNGDEAGAYSYLDLLNLPHNTVSDYATIAGRAFDQYAQKKLYDKSLSGSSTRSSGSGTSSNGSGWTNSQLRGIASDFSKMDGSEPLYNYYKQVLTDAGWLDAETDTGTDAPTQSGYTGPSQNSLLQVDMRNKWITAPAQEQALKWANAGQSEDQIMDKLLKKGLSDVEVYNVMKKLKKEEKAWQ